MKGNRPRRNKGIIAGAMLAAVCAAAPAGATAAASGASSPGAESTAVQTAQAARGEAARADRSARAEFVDRNGNRIGDATLQQTPHGVLITVNFEKAPPGVRAFHIHETGRCSPTFEAAGDHFNPAGHQHGLLNPKGKHAGDLPNLHIPDTGRLTVEVLARDVTLEPDQRHSLLAGDGTALVIHERGDDHRSDPTGEAGGRVACAVIEN